ncbi:MAG: DMT family transporter [Actinomycetes bacterium]
MAWLVLLLSAVLEAVWATALSESAGLTRVGPTGVFVVATLASVVGLGWAMTFIPTGTAYAAWTGIGAVLTVAWAAVTGAEVLTPLKAVFLLGIVACVVGLKLTEPVADADTTRGRQSPRSSSAS